MNEIVLSIPKNTLIINNMVIAFKNINAVTDIIHKWTPDEKNSYYFFDILLNGIKVEIKFLKREEAEEAKKETVQLWEAWLHG